MDQSNLSMNKVIAKTLSILLHPLLMPTLGLLYILNTNTTILLLSFDAKKIIVTIVAINTFALPLLMIPLFYRFKIVKNISMHGHRERIIPLAFTLVPYIFSFYFLSRLPIATEIPLFMLGASATVAIALITTIWWKISLHMIGVGGIAGLLFALSYKFHVDVLWHLAIVIILSGLLAWARLWLNSHKPSQVYIGFITGWVIVWLSVVIM